MTIPRLKIADLMTAVLILALNFGLGRALLGWRGRSIAFAELIIFGCLPMADILIVGLILLRRSRPGAGPRRPYLVGFEAFGLVGWLLALAGFVFSTARIYEAIPWPLEVLGMRPGPLKALGCTILILLPQLALAHLGGRIYLAFSPGARAVEGNAVGSGAARPS